MRPNGRTAWIPAKAARVARVRTEIVVFRGARRLEVWRDGRRLLWTRVAVGAPRWPTPLGSFYVTAKFKASNPFYGSYALETSAYSTLSDWPGGGVVGIHGTNRPHLLGRAVSHGCIRVSNRAALALKRLVPVGAPVRIRR